MKWTWLTAGTGPVVSTVLALRHCERDKKLSRDKQVPTHGSEIDAYEIGWDLRGKFLPVDLTSSEMDRTARTARIVESGIRGWQDYPLLDLFRDPRLNDYSSDEDPVVIKGLAAAKKLAAERSIEPEAAMFLCDEGQAALEIKLPLAMEVIGEMTRFPGGHLTTHHGGTIDGMWQILMGVFSRTVPMINIPANGTFGYVQGWFAGFNEQGELVRLEQHREPSWHDAWDGGPSYVKPWEPEPKA